MAFEGVEKCAVSSCKGSCYGPCNLCREHAVPGDVVCVGDGTGIVAFWYAEHDGERGLIVVDDQDLGELFDGVEGFRATLKIQGFEEFGSCGPQKKSRRLGLRSSRSLLIGAVPGALNTHGKPDGRLSTK